MYVCMHLCMYIFNRSLNGAYYVSGTVESTVQFLINILSITTQKVLIDNTIIPFL